MVVSSESGEKLAIAVAAPIKSKPKPANEPVVEVVAKEEAVVAMNAGVVEELTLPSVPESNNSLPQDDLQTRLAAVAVDKRLKPKKQEQKQEANEKE